ncbi:MAG: bifunctional demethylmenaquinone methyltransferase/2-methoxy-6-polyprenyl-1,4-benzoquinol methylase UbiE [Methylococcales bacterium]|nr:bifunctional demethylmenaquinone methyltransferase/2-methoxy-6-polyprenyl-1,4-benzoquinol methylase UbiE [Methylococcales bacterium]MBT7442544.1 bifunctional demethylmenaquinone methyltransferase/2-methoxy-6-polyprenyl-1,4-benzoquinol methylase UbiE [Methylococcales bacterium]
MTTDKHSDDKTHFGYQTVDKDDKASMVADVFHSVADQYDIMNDAMSFGIHRLWKRFAIDLVAAQKGHRILDLAGGTGDLALRFSPIVGPEGEIVLCDINGSMLSVGRDRLIDKGVMNNVRFVQGDAQYLPFPDEYFDRITIAFGLRNVTDKDLALRAMHRVLKPGGRLLVLEFSKPVVPGLSKIYDFYSFSILPKLGKLIANDADSYQYLAESIRMHPDQETLKNMMVEAGFEKTEFFNMTGGIVAAHRGIKL